MAIIEVNQVEVNQELSADAQYLSRRYDLTSIIQNTARDCVAAYVGDRSSNPLLTYDLHGENLTNLGEEKQRNELEQNIATCITEAIGFRDVGGLSRTERQMMGHFLPKLVQALVLDKDVAKKIYEKDVLAPVRIALDWFMNPQDIEQTHFRVGYGGEYQVYTRAPAYIAPSLQTLRAIKQAFVEQTNWSLLHELHDRRTANLNEDEADVAGREINEWIDQRKKEGVTQEKDIILDAWSYFLDETPDMEELSRRYHFTDKLPKLVVFNAANAAVEINGKDRDQVLEARHQTQRLLEDFVNRFFPDLSSCLEFQNDLPWEKHDTYTQLFLLFLRDFVESQDGEVSEKNATMENFGRHHQQDSNSSINGIPGSLFYALLHPSFFEDPYLRGVFPRPSVMDQVLSTPRNVIWHQGEPEIEFGMYRKLITETITSDQFLQWLQQKRLLISSGGESLERVTELVQTLQQENLSREFRSCLGQAIGQGCKDQDLKRLFTTFLRSTEFVNAENPPEVWQAFVDRTLSETSLFTAEDIDTVVAQIKDFNARLEQFRRNHEFANIHQDYLNLKNLADSEEMALAYNPKQRLELVTSIGEQEPTYYQASADGRIWPILEPTSLSRYSSTLQRAAARRERVGGTVGFTIETVIPSLLVETTNEYSLFFGGVDQFVDDATSEAIQKSWENDNTTGFEGIYLSIDTMEEAAETKGTIIRTLREAITNLVECQVQKVREATGISYEQALVFVANRADQLLLNPASTAGEQLGRLIKIDLAHELAALNDYKYLLASIDPDEADAERMYNEFLTSRAA